MASSASTQHGDPPAKRRLAISVLLGFLVGSAWAGPANGVDAVRAAEPPAEETGSASDGGARAPAESAPSDGAPATARDASPDSTPAAPGGAEPEELAIFLGYGALQGPGIIDQYTLDGDRVGRVELARPASGIERRGDKLVVAASTFIVGAGRMLSIDPDGTVNPLLVDGRFGAPIALALDFATQDLIVSDNEAHTVSRIALSEDGTRAKITRLFPAPLTAGHEHFPSMSAAATTAGEVVFSASDPLGIFRLPPGSERELPVPLVPAIDAAVEADPTSPRWAAMLANELVVYQGAEEQRRIDRPDNAMFWHYKVMTFGPDGRLYVVLQTPRGFEVQSVDVITGQYSPHVVFKANRARCLAVGRRMPWKP